MQPIRKRDEEAEGGKSGEMPNVLFSQRVEKYVEYL